MKKQSMFDRLVLQMITVLLFMTLLASAAQAKEKKNENSSDSTFPEATTSFDPYNDFVTDAWVGDFYYDSKGQILEIPLKKEIIDSGTSEMNKEKKRLIIVGASRVVHMQKHTSNYSHTLYVCKSGAGYKWFVRDAIPQLRAYLALYPNSTVVIQLGNNDVNHGHANRITKYVKQY